MEKEKTYKYTANVRSYRGTSLNEPLRGNSKQKLVREIETQARRHRAYGTSCEYIVWLTDSGRVVANGTINKDGAKVSVGSLIGTFNHP